MEVAVTMGAFVPAKDLALDLYLLTAEKTYRHPGSFCGKGYLKKRGLANL
jgi:hypothetical protein